MKDIRVSISLTDVIRSRNMQFEEDSWIETQSGKILNFLNMSPDSICLDDIAHGLAHTCRFAGQIGQFYSVAEHSILVGRLCEALMHVKIPGIVESAHMHDAPEGYIGDMTSPLKRLCPGFQIIEKELESLIHSTFGLGIPFSNPSIKKADFMMFEIERDKFRNLPKEERKHELPEGLEIRCLSPVEAKREFLERAEELGIRRV